MAALDPTKGHAALRRGRFSAPGATYFLTLCTEARRTGLTAKDVATSIHREITAMEADGTWTKRSHVIMPDHLHALIILGDRLPLARAIQRFKAKTSGVLQTASLTWERCRAGLIGLQERWPHYHCAAADWEWFSGQLDRELPIPEWLAR